MIRAWDPRDLDLQNEQSVGAKGSKRVKKGPEFVYECSKTIYLVLMA